MIYGKGEIKEGGHTTEKQPYISADGQDTNRLLRAVRTSGKYERGGTNAKLYDATVSR